MRPSSAGVVLEARNVWPSYFRLEEIEAELWQQGWKGHFDYLWWLPEIGTTKQSVAFLRFKNKADIKLLKDKYIDGDIRTAKEQDLSQCVTLLRQIYKTYEDALPFLPRFYNPWGEHMPLKTLSAEDASLGTMVPLDPMSAAYLPKNDFRREDQLRGIENFHHKSWQKGGDKGWSSGKPLHHDPWAKNRENAGSMYYGGKGGGMYHGGKGGMGIYSDGKGGGVGIYSDGKGGGMGIYPDGKGGGMGFYPDGKGGGMGIYSDGKGGGMGIYTDGKGGGMGRHPDSRGGGMGRYPDGKGGGMYHDGKGDRRVPNYEGDIGGVVPFYMGKGVKNDTVTGKIDLTQTVLQDDWAVGARKNGPHQRDDQRKDRADRPLREERQHQSDIDALEERMRRLEVRDPDFTRAHWREEPMRSPPQDHRSLPRSGNERHFALRIPPWGERRNDLGPLHLDENSILSRGERRNELGPRHVNERVKSPHRDRVFEDILSTHSSRGRDSAFDVLSSHARRCGEPVRWRDSRQVGDDRRRGYGQYGDERGNPRSGEEQAPHHYREEREAEKENERPWYPANTKNTVQEEAVKELRQTYFRLARAVMDHPIYRLPDSQKGSSGCVEKGEEVEVVQICGEWANIIFPSTGNKAWVFENALDVQKCPSCSYCQTTICPGYCCKCCKQTPGSHGPKCLRYEAPL